MLTKYKTRPYVMMEFEAVKVTAENAETIRESGIFPIVASACGGKVDYTMRGEVIKNGDYLIRWKDGGTALYNSDQFELNYEPA